MSPRTARPGRPSHPSPEGRTGRSPAAVAAGLLRAGFGRRTRLRWVHLLLGGALLMPYFLVSSAVLQLVWRQASPFSSVGMQFAAYTLSLPLVALTAWLFPLVRTLETYAAQALCGVPAGALAPGPAVSRAARRRSTAWFTLHIGVGTLLSGTSLAVPPMVLMLLLAPAVPSVREADWRGPWDFLDGPLFWLAPPVALATLVLLLAAVHGAGALLARWAPVLLGPTPADRLAAAEERAARLALRNRLAADLHDSVGHALSAASLQANAARRVLDTDPAFAREALVAIEETTREAVAELDSVLGVLRAEESDAPGDGPRPAPAHGGPEPGRTATGETGPAARDGGLPGIPASAAGPPGSTGGSTGHDGPTGDSDRSRDADDPDSADGTERAGPVEDGTPRRRTPVSGPASPTLASGLGGLLRRTRAAGMPVRCTGTGASKLEAVPGEVSHAGYRIVQEGLSNALRHAGDRHVRLRLERREEELRITMENPLPRAGTGHGAVAVPAGGARPAGPEPRAGGGHGLRGITERAALLGGRAEAGPVGDRWRLEVRLPLHDRPRAAAPYAAENGAGGAR